MSNDAIQPVICDLVTVLILLGDTLLALLNQREQEPVKNWVYFLNIKMSQSVEQRAFASSDARIDELIKQIWWRDLTKQAGEANLNLLASTFQFGC